MMDSGDHFLNNNTVIKAILHFRITLERGKFEGQIQRMLQRKLNYDATLCTPPLNCLLAARES